MKKENKQSSKIEELFLYYNRYLAHDNDEYYLLYLIRDLTNIFISKTPSNGIYDENFDVLNLKYNEKDLVNLSPFAKECIRFWSGASINIANDIIAYIDRFGTIVSIENKNNIEYVKKENIFEFLDENTFLDLDEKSRKDAWNVISQNRLTSKIYKAVYEAIFDTIGERHAAIFKLVNGEIIDFDEKLLNKYNKIEQLYKGFSRVRSAR